MTEHIWWYAARSGGLVAWALLATSTIAGLMLSGRVRPGRRARPAWMLDLHRFLGGLAVTFTAVHVGGVLLDSYTDIGLVDVLVPMTSSWRPGAVAWGVVGLWLLAAVELTSLAKRHLPHQLWRRIHVLSLPLYAVATAHFVQAGTDAEGPVVLGLVAVTSMVVAGLTAWRVVRPRAEHRPVTARVAAPVS